MSIRIAGLVCQGDEMSAKLVVCALLAGVLAGDVYGSAPRAMCICPQRGIADEFKRSDVVFVGTAVSGDVERVVMKVDRLWKGSLPPLATLLNLTKSLPTGDTFFTGCDYRIGTDAPVVIFAMRGANGDLSTGICTRNGPASNKTLIDSLNKLANPYPPKASRWLIFAFSLRIVAPDPHRGSDRRAATDQAPARNSGLLAGVHPATRVCPQP